MYMHQQEAEVKKENMTILQCNRSYLSKQEVKRIFNWKSGMERLEVVAGRCVV